MRFKNDKERGAFLDDYRNYKNGWYLWKEDEEIGRRMWRRDLPGCAMIVEEQKTTYRWPKSYEAWAVLGRYIIEDWEKPFADGFVVRSQALAKIKELSKGGKEI